MVDRSRLVAFGLVISLALVLSASAGTTAGEPDGDELLEKAIESLANEPIEAVHTQKIVRPDGEIIQTVAIHRDSTQSGYLEILDSTTQQTGQQMVFDDSTVWRQNLEEGTAVQYDKSDPYLFDEFQTLGAAPEAITGHYDGEYRGTGEVDGRESYVVDLVPPEKTTAGLSLDIDAGDLDYEVPIHEAGEQQWYLSQETWWIDSETYYPLKQSVEWVDEDGNIIASATREYEEISIGSDVETSPGDNLRAGEILNGLETEADSDGETRNSSAMTDDIEIIESEVYDTRQGVNASVPFTLPTINVPEEYTFTHANVEFYQGTHTVLLWYEAEDMSTPLSVQITEKEQALTRYNLLIEREDISSFDGEVVVTDSGTEVVRQCDDLTYRVRGPPVAETLIGVTTSIEC